MATAAACFKCVQRGKSWTFSRWETGMCEGLTSDVRGQNKRVFVNLPIDAPARGKHWKKKPESCRLRSPRTHSRLHFSLIFAFYPSTLFSSVTFSENCLFARYAQLQQPPEICTCAHCRRQPELWNTRYFVRMVIYYDYFLVIL